MPVIKCSCNHCGRFTNHSVKRQLDRDYEPDNDFPVHATWQIVECLGCETVSFREAWEEIDHRGNDVEREVLYPRRREGTREPKMLLSVPARLRAVYHEVNDAHNYGLKTLCAAGLRALVEGICEEAGISDGPKDLADASQGRSSKLEGRINGLAERGVLSRDHAAVLHEHRFMGNDALHEMDSPGLDELALGIEIVEGTLDTLYELPARGERLRFTKARRRKP